MVTRKIPIENLILVRLLITHSWLTTCFPIFSRYSLTHWYPQLRLFQKKWVLFATAVKLLRTLDFLNYNQRKEIMFRTKGWFKTGRVTPFDRLVKAESGMALTSAMRIWGGWRRYYWARENNPGGAVECGKGRYGSGKRTGEQKQIARSRGGRGGGGGPTLFSLCRFETGWVALDWVACCCRGKCQHSTQSVPPLLPLHHGVAWVWHGVDLGREETS